VTELLGLAALDLVLAALGAGVLLASGAWDRLAPWSRVGPALFVGLAATTAALGMLVYLGVSPTPAVAALLAGLALVGGLALRPRPSAPRDPSGGGALAALAVAVLGTPLALRALAEPLVKFDSYSDWSLKARLLYGHGGLLLGALDERSLGPAYAFAHREYPLGLPALEALGFHAAGSASARVVHAQLLVLLGSFAATVWSLLRPRVDPLLLGACLCLLVVAPGLHTQLLAGYADVPLACFWALAALALLLWVLWDGSDRLVLAGVLAAAAAATKQEGGLFGVALLVTVALALVVTRQARRLVPLAVMAGAVLASTLPWRIWVAQHGLHDADIAPGPRRMLDQVGQVPAIVRRLTAELVWVRWPGILPLAVVVALALLVPRSTRLLAATFLAVLGAAFAGLVLVYWNARVGVAGLLQTSAERVVVAPLLLAAVFLPLLLARLRDSRSL
jgi:hypothetical protein